MRVLAFYREGSATRREDITASAGLTIEDSGVAELDHGRLVGRRIGSTTARALFKGQFSEATVEVGARVPGQRYEFLGGVREVRALRFLGDDLLFTTASDTVTRIANGSLETLSRLAMPRSAAYGLNLIGVDEALNVFVHSLWNSATYILRPSDGYQRFDQLNFSAGTGGIASFCQLPDHSYLFGAMDGTLLKSDDLVRFETVFKFPTLLASMTCSGDELFCVSGGARDGVYRLDLLRMVLEWWHGGISSPSDIASYGGDLLITDFHKGYLYRVHNLEETTCVATNLGNPTSLAVLPDGRAFVGEFSGDVVSVVTL